MKSMFRSLVATVLTAGMLVMPVGSRALDLVGEDIDLFMTNPAIPAEIPNVLIVLDNTSNWSQQAQHWPAMVDATCIAAGITGNQQGDAEVCAIYKQVSKLTETVNVGLMMFNDNSPNIGGPGGAYVRFSVRPMNASNRTAFQTTLSRINTNNPGDKGPSAGNYESPMNDAFRYFNSLATFAGSGAAASAADTTGYVSSAKINFQFANLSASSCGFDYIIFIGNGFPSQDRTYASELTTAAALLNDAANVTPNTAAINTTGSNSDVWARFLYNYGVKVGPGAYRHVTTYSIDVCKDQCSADQETLLRSMASVSYGGYFKATNMDAISTALDTIFSQVQAVNSVFAATSLPVSINVRGTNLNQVYIGVFRPDSRLSPRWFGNLKQYKLGISSDATGSLQLVDAAGAGAVNLNTGFVFNTAKSFWTSDSTFWSFRSPYKPTDAGKQSDSPDGDLVEKGGAAERIRLKFPNPDSSTDQTRNIYTCTDSCLGNPNRPSLSATPFNTSNTEITAALLGTYQTINVSSLTASGTTATATAAVVHGFSTGDQVTVSGAVPNLFNGTFAIASVPTTTSFTYSLSPNTPDTTHAYATFNTLSSSGLVVGSDLITVAGASPNDYNVSEVPFAAVVGNVNQITYTLASSPTSAASGYSVTAKRLISNTPNSTNLVWSSALATGNVTVIKLNHGYVAGDSVTISGVTDSTGALQTALNGTFTVTQADATSFKYTASGTPSGGQVTTGVATIAGAVPAGWGNGTTVTISGAAPAGYNNTATITNLNATAGTFQYTTNGAVLTDATTPGSVLRVVSNDTSTWTVSAGTTTGSGSGKKIRLTLSRGKYSGQVLHPLATTDTIAIANCSYNIGSGGNAVNKSCSGLTMAAISGNSGVTTSTVAANTYADISGTVTIDLNLAAADNASQLNSVTVVATAKGAAPGVGATTLAWTGTTTSASVALTSIVRGTITVNANGTVYATKTGDLTSLVTSIANQAVATGTITAGLSTNPDPNEFANLIAWVRGLDNKDNENLNSDATDVRSSVHGDVLHSRPAVVNYNRNNDDNDVYLFYGANDGMFHAVRGGQYASSVSDPPGGNEQWSFIPKEFFGKLKRLRNQTPVISSLSPRDYFFDGPIGTYSLDADQNARLGGDNDKVYLFVGMRRGGRYIYALDVSDPANPKFMWRKGCPNKTGHDGCDPGYSELGQTWSEPKLGYVRGYKNADNSPRLVLMFGAGFDAPVEDFQPCAISSFSSSSVTAKTGVVFPNEMTATNCPPSGGSSTSKNRSMGRGIYIVDALNGRVLWRAVSNNAHDEVVSGMTTVQVSGMDYAIAADLAVLKSRDNTSTRPTAGIESVPTGYLDRIYAVDTGGNVWRVDVSNADRSQWVITKLAAIGGSSLTDMRKFMSSPDVVYSKDSNGVPYDAVLLGSGDREHPFDQVVANRFYMFKDKNIGTITPDMVDNFASQSGPATLKTRATLGESDLVDVTSDCLQDISFCTGGETQTALAADMLSKQGWMLKLVNSGEKTIAPATTAAGTVIFNTNQPKQDTVSGTANNVGENAAANQCTSDLGTARQYGVNFQTGTSSDIFAALPTQYQSTTGRFATFAGGGFLPSPVPVVVQIDGKFYQTVISGVQATNPGGLTMQSRLRTYWYNRTR